MLSWMLSWGLVWGGIDECKDEIMKDKNVDWSIDIKREWEVKY